MISPEDEAIGKLEAEFSGYQVWTDFRSHDDGQEHWHARRPGWTARQIISASSAAELRRKLRASS